MFILAENIRVFAHQGPDPEGRALAREYVVHAKLGVDFSRASANDSLQDTLDYTTMHLVAAHEMRSAPANLMEHFCHRILEAYRNRWPGIAQGVVRVELPAPPLRSAVGRAFVEMDLTGKARIGLEDVRLFALHGVYPEEGSLGNHYSLDCSLKLDARAAAASDDLAQTVNYESLFAILCHEMALPSQLLERVGRRIQSRTLQMFPLASGFSLRLAKLNPPVRGRMGSAAILLEEDYEKKCPRCKQDFTCVGNPHVCWCRAYAPLSFAARYEQEKYQGCICRSCLETAGA